MSVSKIAAIVLSLAAVVVGHGYVSGAVVDGQYYGGYLVNKYNYMKDPPEVIGWSEDEKDLGYIDGSGYSSPNIICHKDAKPSARSAQVKAGGTVELQWTKWPDSHHGPVISYLANCNGDCSSVDKSTLKFFKIDAAGLIDDSNVPGTWATDQLIANNNSRTITIPRGIASGNYVLRHEIIALHSAENKDGAQNYPQCLNLQVTGGGGDAPTGALGTELYKDTDPGILVNIYHSLSSYTIPGPALYIGSSGPAGISASSSAAPSPSGTSSAVASVTPRPQHSASSGSITRIRRPSALSLSFSFTRFPRPSFRHSPEPPVTPSPAPPSMLGGPEYPPRGDVTVTETTTAQLTDRPTFQIPGAPLDRVTVTVNLPGGQSEQSSPPASDNAPVPPPNASATPGATPSSGGGSGSGSGSSGPQDWTSYLNSLSADQALNMLRQTVKWLTTDKMHARDLS